MPSTLSLLDHDPVTYSEAKAKEFNVIQRHAHVSLTEKLYRNLWDHREAISAITKQQLGLNDDAMCNVPLPQHWMRGSFNICIPIEVNSQRFQQKLILRCPMPYKLAESNYPGAIDEKLRSEIGAHVWLQEHCPDIRIPKLYGFSLSNRHFTHEARLPWYYRAMRTLSRLFRSLFRHSTLSQYAATTISTQLPTQYMLLEYIGPDKATMLSSSFNTHMNDSVRRRNLFQGLARIMISLSRKPQPKIGSFQFQDDCTISLTNRPLFAATTILENRGAQRSIHPGTTYACTEPYVADMITVHDNYFYSNRSATDEKDDCRSLMAIQVLLRTLSHHFIKKEYRNGPFAVQLTDFHQSNIFVNESWEEIYIIDLEWLCALPIESLTVPPWLTGCDLADIVDKDGGHNLTNYNLARQEFMKALSNEASKAKLAWPLTAVMEEMWESKGFWFWQCLISVNAAYYLVDDHLCPQFSSELAEVEVPLSQLWRRDAQQVIEKKMSDFQAYTQELDAIFNEA